MPAGIEITNSSNTILIDENYANLSLRGSGTITIALDATGRHIISIPHIPGGLRKPIIATYVTNGSAGVIRSSNNDALGTASIQFTGTPGAIVKWYRFDMPTATSNVGIQLFDASGAPTFDSGNKYARVVSDWTGSGTTWYGDSRTLAAGREYAVAWLRPWGRVTSTSRQGGCSGARMQYKATDLAQVCTFSSANAVSINQLQYDTDLDWSECTSNDPRAHQSQFVLAILDVTGY